MFYSVHHGCGWYLFKFIVHLLLSFATVDEHLVTSIRIAVSLACSSSHLTKTAMKMLEVLKIARDVKDSRVNQVPRCDRCLLAGVLFTQLLSPNDMQIYLIHWLTARPARHRCVP